MTCTSTVGVLGGGSWGTAIAHLLRTSAQKPDTLLWLRSKKVARSIRDSNINSKYLPDQELAPGIRPTHSLQEVAQQCRVIFLVVPTKVMRQVARELGQWLTAEHILISCSKGLEPETAKRMTEVLREETCCIRVGALSGPNLAKEIIANHPSATVVASAFDQVVTEATRVLIGDRFRVYGNSDVLGVELGGALKNVVAIAAGTAAGLGFGDNTKSLIVTRGLAEIRRLGDRLGAVGDTFAGLAGVGDLMVTCASPLSRNHQVGRRLAAGESLDDIARAMNQVAEGLNTARVVHQVSKKLNVPMPISTAVYQMAYEGRTPDEVLLELMRNQATYEIDRPILL